MNFNYIKLFTISLFLSQTGLAKAQNSFEKIHLGLIYPISTNGKSAYLDTNDVSVNLIAGVSSVEKGVSFAGISNIIRNEANGTQFAGFSNHIGKNTNGAIFAGFLNTYKDATGVQFAGFANIAGGDIQGSQFAGFANTSKNITGAQFGGFINVAKNVSLSQFGGFINVAKNINGAQFAGFINIAKKVKGAQVSGFINVADSSDCPIGILNFIKKGEKSVGLSFDEKKTVMLTLRSGGKSTYGIIGVGYNFTNKDEVYAFEAGLGAHFFQSKFYRLNAELTASTLESFRDGEYFKSSLKALSGVRLNKHFEIFGGPALNLVTTNTVEGKVLHAKKNIATWQSNWSDFTQYLYLGYNAGLHIIF